ncbi:sugar transferase [Proteiniphilum sp.]|uniref:sugar transferase n=1 Tax=Proteiniphilum sp. TaxID=1926877 RepID=UPI002B200040|nr:sugar transferase [Proteiniphilum sp.]MEA4915965.1 sugar transferase [Proteiniphilum sp.]
MNPTVIYIGKNEELTVYFSCEVEKVLSEIPFVFKNYKQAVHWLISHPKERSTIIFFERDRLDMDIENIRYFRKNFPYAYILLVTEELDPEERLQYIRSGVIDTCPPTVQSEALRQFFHFISKYQPDLQRKKEGQEKTPVASYKIPVTKRIFDVVVSFFALIILLPLLIIISAAIWIENKGPVLYRSKRVGSNYHIFDFWKFRSMYTDADKRLKEMEKFNQYGVESPETEQSGHIFEIPDSNFIGQSDQTFLVDDDVIIPEKEYISKNRQKKGNAFIKIEKDPRITKVGHFIRKYSLDELPQLLNVLKGDMSIVGNRPLPLYEAELLTQDQSIERFIAPAGLTGLWQVEKRGSSGKLSAEERKQLDIYYAQHYSVWLDIKIIFRTFTAFIQKEDV